ncbi:YezD family protein [Pectinatus brassicae]|uniref:DUF2292 domain-containing protein n=1 Tax=Pectinatus brassicae TaxID=862415 RepID=A0A840UQU8_9FIRM|nr:YezD family protein [Pectinatus brassicae]MBB5335373.1 hypothetical protein [Pectinatus brassicae]
MAGEKIINKNNKLSSAALKIITSLMQEIFHGEINLIVQNSCLIQIERNEKMRLVDISKYAAYHKKTQHIDYTPVCEKIQQEFSDLAFGNIAIIIKSGKVTQVEKTEKYRFSDFTGMDGEGI